MTEEKQGAAEWLRGIVDEAYMNEAYPSCVWFARTFFGIECRKKSTCTSCILSMFKAIADRIDAERALPEGIEWPRFEDGELVRIGDEVEYGGKALEVDAICFDREEWSMALRRNLDISRMSGSYDERVKRPTLKVLGADGASINVGDTVYFADGNGSALIVERIDANGGEPAVDLVYEGERTRWHSANPESLTHERPDSWERLEEDMKGGPTEYARDILGVNVRTTTTSEDYEAFARDTVRRAKALAKAGEVE